MLQNKAELPKIPSLQRALCDSERDTELGAHSAPCTRVKLLCVDKPPLPPAFHTSFRCILSDILNAERLRDADHLHLAPCPQDTRLQEKRPLSGGLR